jgi:hypothetical protein
MIDNIKLVPPVKLNSYKPVVIGESVCSKKKETRSQLEGEVEATREPPHIG